MVLRKDAAGPYVCELCDRKNRESVLRLAARVRVVDECLADFLVTMTSYRGEFEQKH